MARGQSLLTQALSFSITKAESEKNKRRRKKAVITGNSKKNTNSEQMFVSFLSILRLEITDVHTNHTNALLKNSIIDTLENIGGCSATSLQSAEHAGEKDTQRTLVNI